MQVARNAPYDVVKDAYEAGKKQQDAATSAP
jgi:hypothetical protein